MRALAMTTVLYLLAASAIGAVPARSGSASFMLSEASVLGLQIAVELDGNAPASVRQCFSALKKDHFSAAAQQALAARFSTQELMSVDAFAASPLAKKFQAYNFDYFRQTKGISVPNPVMITAEESDQLRQFEATPAGAKFMAELAGVQRPPGDPLTLAVRQTVQQCRSAS